MLDPHRFLGSQLQLQLPPAVLILLAMAQPQRHLPETHHQHMVHPKLKLVRAMVLLPLHLMEHRLVTVPPRQPMEAPDKQSLKLDPAEATQVLEPLVLMEDTKSPPLQPRYHQPAQGDRHSMADTPVLLLSQRLLSYQRGGSVARTALTVEADSLPGKGTTRIAL